MSEANHHDTFDPTATVTDDNLRQAANLARGCDVSSDVVMGEVTHYEQTFEAVRWCQANVDHGAAGSAFDAADKVVEFLHPDYAVIYAGNGVFYARKPRRLE